MNQNFTIKQFLYLKNYDDLITFYETRIEQNSENYIDYIYLGLAYVLNGNQIEGETTWFYLLTQEKSEYTDLLTSVLDEITVGFIENNQIDFAILVYQNLKSIEPNYLSLPLQINSVIKKWIDEGIYFVNNYLFTQAKSKYQLILQFEDSLAYLWQNLSSIHYELFEYQKAYQAIIQAIDLEPENYLCYYYAGILLEKLNEIQSALSSYQKSIELNPKHIDSYNNLGNLLSDNNQIKEAEKYYLLALEIDNNHFGTCINLGNLYLKNDQVTSGLKYYHQAININPNYDEFLCIINNIYSFNYVKEAINFARNNCSLLSNNLLANLECHRLLPFLYENQEETKYYRQNLTYFLEQLSNLSLNLQQNKESALKLLERSTINYYLGYQGKNDLYLQSLYGTFIHQVMKANYPEYCEKIKQETNNNNLKIGYISYHLRSHVVGKLFLGWIKHHNASQFDIYTYYLGDLPQDNITNEFKKHSDYFYHFKDNIDIENIAKHIRENQLDILVYLDLFMQPRSLQLAGLKLAPIQCCAWGHPVTSGIPTIDYFISSELMEGENSDNHYSEKLIKLPNLGIVYPQRKLPKTEKNRAKFSLKDNKVIYLCSQFVSKYLPSYDYIYPEIAFAVKNCQFVFIHPNIGKNHDKITEQLWARIKRSFSNYQLDWQDYCVFLPTIRNGEDYWQFLKSCDIFLDTIGFTGFNSTLDALESFLPVVTYSGEFFRTRQSEGILNMIQVTDTVAESVEDYIKLAIRLGQNTGLRNNIRDKIRENIYLLYDDLAPVKTLENFYESFTH